MGKALGGERCSVWKLLTSYVREPSTEYRASDGKKTFLDLGWEYISPDEDLRRRGGKTCFVFQRVVHKSDAEAKSWENVQYVAKYLFKKKKRRICERSGYRCRMKP